MGIMNKIEDAAVKGMTRAETIRLPYEELVKIVDEEFVRGADDTFLEKVEKTARGGVVFSKEMKSVNERYEFHVGTRPNGLLWLNSKPVWVLDKQVNKFYQLDKNLKWKKFYRAIKVVVAREKVNRNR